MSEHKYWVYCWDGREEIVGTEEQSNRLATGEWFDCPRKAFYFKYLYKIPLWTVRQAAFLLVGQRPDPSAELSDEANKMFVFIDQQYLLGSISLCQRTNINGKPKLIASNIEFIKLANSGGSPFPIPQELKDYLKSRTTGFDWTFTQAAEYLKERIGIPTKEMILLTLFGEIACREEDGSNLPLEYYLFPDYYYKPLEHLCEDCLSKHPKELCYECSSKSAVKMYVAIGTFIGLNKVFERAKFRKEGIESFSNKNLSQWGTIEQAHIRDRLQKIINLTKNDEISKMSVEELVQVYGCREIKRREDEIAAHLLVMWCPHGEPITKGLINLRHLERFERFHLGTNYTYYFQPRNELERKGNVGKNIPQEQAPKIRKNPLFEIIERAYLHCKNKLKKEPTSSEVWDELRKLPHLSPGIIVTSNKNTHDPDEIIQEITDRNLGWCNRAGDDKNLKFTSFKNEITKLRKKHPAQVLN